MLTCGFTSHRASCTVAQRSESLELPGLPTPTLTTTLMLSGSIPVGTDFIGGAAALAVRPAEPIQAVLGATSLAAATIEGPATTGSRSAWHRPSSTIRRGWPDCYSDGVVAGRTLAKRSRSASSKPPGRRRTGLGPAGGAQDGVVAASDQADDDLGDDGAADRVVEPVCSVRCQRPGGPPRAALPADCRPDAAVAAEPPSLSCGPELPM